MSVLVLAAVIAALTVVGAFLGRRQLRYEQSLSRRLRTMTTEIQRVRTATADLGIAAADAGASMRKALAAFTAASPKSWDIARALRQPVDR